MKENQRKFLSIGKWKKKIFSYTTFFPQTTGSKSNLKQLIPEALLIRSFHIICREWRTYFKDPYNYFDWLGLVLTFLVLPLRFAEVKSQWSLAGLGYLFNFLRLFKFSCVTR